MASYRDLLEKHPPLGRAECGEIERIPDHKADPKGGPYGLVTSTAYFSIVREPVRFPSGTSGVYYRIFKGDPLRRVVGAAALPLRLQQNGGFDIGLQPQWRYPVSGWMQEIPRGTLHDGEDEATGAERELAEETGLPAPDVLIHLGDLVMDSGDSPSQAAHFAAVYFGEGLAGMSKHDDSEAFAPFRWVPLAEWRARALETPIDGRPVGGIDSFTAGAIGMFLTSGIPAELLAARDVVTKSAWTDLPALGPGLRGTLSGHRPGGTLQPGGRYPVHIRAGDEDASTRQETLSPFAIAWLALQPGISLELSAPGI